MPKFQNVSDPCFTKGIEVEATVSHESLRFRDPTTSRVRVRPIRHWIEVRETVALVEERGVKANPQARTSKTWIISVIDADGTLAPAKVPTQYTSEKQAHAVAKSMAERHRGNTFVVFEATGLCHVPKEFNTEIIRL